MDKIIRDKTNIFVKHVFVKTFLVMSFPSLSSAFDIPMEGSDLLVRTCFFENRRKYRVFT